ncbi:uncharacterized protein DFL_003585 [Arthrobotrys flagrans]|uniref:Uncharacterized protein n=1 Tax=Arthrobotrys flagrans TaxID=97331 RepID=A0A437A292_ARTFL|nr:hypothetical protein DFL_003585 [Arthrobotrys flagrans]
MTSTADDIDPLVLQNRIAVVAAQRRKLIESLLRPPTAEELKNAKSAEEIAAEEEELWKPRPATLGAGHPIPASASATETYNREHDLLRRRLLGQSIMKDARQRHQERTQHQPRFRGVADSDSSDDDGEQTSRGAIGKKSPKKRKFGTEDGYHAKARAVDVHRSGSDSDASAGGGFVSLITKSATPKGKKVKKEQKASKHEAASEDSDREDDGSDADAEAATSTSTKFSLAEPLTQRILTGEKIVLVGENKRRKKKKKKKNKDHNSTES